jgi:ferredoxin/flavodoxin
MKIAIIYFSPSGNTHRAAVELQNELVKKGHGVSLLNIAGNSGFFGGKDISGFLEENVWEHDALVIGSPVYAHHLQYHVQDLINALPAPGGKWGKNAFTFVTYGGISSGVALKEAAALLKKSGRRVIAGMKISSPHRMTRGFMVKEYNSEKFAGGMPAEIGKFAGLISSSLNSKGGKENKRAFNYNGVKTDLFAKFIFKEKEWHAKRYPGVMIDESKCSACGVCVKNCPVMHLAKTGGKITWNNDSECVHCLNCVTNCSKKAVYLTGDLEKGKAFMNKMIEKNGNKEKPETGIYIGVTF